MIIVLKPTATPADAEEIIAKIAARGMKPLHMPGLERVVIGALGDERALRDANFESHPAVESVKPILTPYKLVGRELHPHDTVVNVGPLSLGGSRFGVIAGPCAVESREQLRAAAFAVKASGAHAIRGGAYKPRTSPYSFQGHGPEAIELLREISDQSGLPVVSEVLDTADVERMADKIDVLQIGARSMQNFALLRAVGQVKRPVILKRGLSATIEELLLAAEYILASGNDQLILCERGIRTFEPATRNTLDLNAVAFIKQRSHLPVLVDPSHGTGVRELVIPMSRAAAAVGADGIMVEVHHNPREALSDGAHALHPHEFARLMVEIEPFVKAAGKTLA